jgi:hypothetical protein
LAGEQKLPNEARTPSYWKVYVNIEKITEIETYENSDYYAWKKQKAHKNKNILDI